MDKVISVRLSTMLYRLEHPWWTPKPAWAYSRDWINEAGIINLHYVLSGCPNNYKLDRSTEEWEMAEEVSEVEFNHTYTAKDLALLMTPVEFHRRIVLPYADDLGVDSSLWKNLAIAEAKKFRPNA